MMVLGKEILGRMLLGREVLGRMVLGRMVRAKVILPPDSDDEPLVPLVACVPTRVGGSAAEEERPLVAGCSKERIPRRAISQELWRGGGKGHRMRETEWSFLGRWVGAIMQFFG